MSKLARALHQMLGLVLIEVPANQAEWSEIPDSGGLVTIEVEREVLVAALKLVSALDDVANLKEWLRERE